jgi:hypothetical protein
MIVKFFNFRCYCCALSLDKEDSLAWHDLAMSYRAQAKFSSEPEELLKKALSAAHQACQLEPSNSEHWNLVGVIAADTGMEIYSLLFFLCYKIYLRQII